MSRQDAKYDLERDRRAAEEGRRDTDQPHSKALTANPKDLFGASKVSISKLPAVAVLHGAHAMMNGAEKYGPYNWRSKAVIASIYVDAAARHLEAWFEGEETATDSGVHHLGHAIACCAILLDAQETGNLVDDRPKGGNYSKVLQRLNDFIKSTKAAEEKKADPTNVFVHGDPGR